MKLFDSNTEIRTDVFKLQKKGSKFVRQIWCPVDASGREERELAEGVGGHYLKRRTRTRIRKST